MAKKPGKFQQALGKMLGRSAPSAVAGLFDPTMADPDMAGAALAMQHGDWQSVEALMDARPKDASVLSRVLTGEESTVRTAAIEQWALEAPSARSFAVLGASQTRDAWAIRGRSTADNVDPNAWQDFFDGLGLAEQTLQKAAAMDPSAAAPWANMLTTARGLQMDKDEVSARFQQAHSREPFEPFACGQMLQSICAKWGGSHDDMFAFARWIEEHAEADSPARMQIFVAHFEHAASEGLAPSEYLNSPSVAGELTAAAAKFVDALPARAETRHVPPLNWMLWGVTPLDARSAKVTLNIIERLDGRAASSPWDYYNGSINGRFNAMLAGRAKTAKKF